MDTQLRAYPQIVGLEKGETDKSVGKYGRLFMLGVSNWLIEFRQSNNEEPPQELPSVPARPGFSSGDPLPDRQSVRSARPSLLTDLQKIEPGTRGAGVNQPKQGRRVETRGKLRR